MRRTHTAYYYSIRKKKRDEEILINERIADSVLQNDTRDIFGQRLNVYVRITLAPVVSSMAKRIALG